MDFQIYSAHHCGLKVTVIWDFHVTCGTVWKVICSIPCSIHSHFFLTLQQSQNTCKFYISSQIYEKCRLNTDNFLSHVCSCIVVYTVCMYEIKYNEISCFGFISVHCYLQIELIVYAVVLLAVIVIYITAEIGIFNPRLQHFCVPFFGVFMMTS